MSSSSSSSSSISFSFFEDFFGPSSGSSQDVGAKGTLLSDSALAGESSEAKEVAEKAKESLGLKTGYEWVDYHVLEYFSKYRWSSMLHSFTSSVDVPGKGVANDIICFRHCKANENVCHGRDDSSDDFFYFYACLWTDVHVRFPFDEFTMGVLHVLNVAPTQLHPNSWAFLQAFRILCEGFHLNPTPQVFLYHYSTRPDKRVGWLSLISQSRPCLLAPYTSSYKNFKKSFFKIVIKKGGREFFFNGDQPKFPFYWTRKPLKYNSWSRSMMTTEDLETLSVLNELPHRLPTRKLLGVYVSPRRWEDLDEIMGSINPKGKSYFKDLRLKRKSSKKGKEVGGTLVLPPHSKLVADRLPPQDAPKRKEKSCERCHGEKSLSKRSRHDPFHNSFFGTKLRVVEKLTFDLNNSEQELYRSATLGEVTDAFMELSTRAMLLGKRLTSEVGNASMEVKKLKKELAESESSLHEALNANAILGGKLKNLEEIHSRCVDEKEALCEKVTKVGTMEKRLQEEVRNLQHSLNGMTLAHYVEQAKGERLEKELAEAQQFVLDQHKLGFFKALQQAAYFYKIPIDKGDFDVEKDFYKGELIPVENIPDEEDGGAVSSLGANQNVEAQHINQVAPLD